MIICAAIKLTMNNIAQTETIICGHRHGDCYKTIRLLDSSWKGAKQTEGFIDHNGIFLNREDALLHAVSCGQINAHDKWYRKEQDLPNELYSEDLY